MKRVLVLIAIATLVTGVAVAPAQAVIIEFSTTGSLNGGPFFSNPVLPIWPGSGGLEFIGLTDVTADASGPFSLGYFKVNGTYGATYGWTPDPLPFTIKVSHASPLPDGDDTFGGVISGSFGSSWSTLMVTLTDNVATIGGHVYEVHALIAPVSHTPQSFDANFTPSPVTTPEPSTLLLVGTGLTGLASVVRRKIGRRKI